MYEVLKCEECFHTWERSVTRGRKPRICPDCRAWGIKPVTVPRRRVTAVDVLLDPNSSPIVFTDGGRKDEGKMGWENSDCTVRAIATATGRPYSEAYHFMAQAGRKPGKGANFHGAIYRAMRTVGNVLGYKFEDMGGFKRARGLKTALERNPALRKGTWVLQQPRHVCTLKDGKILDSFDSSRKEIRGAYRVTRIYNKKTPAV